ncbi:hypothetical protein FRC07_002961 [Ceratobasidium sp. 392]|nr:hypothetical protein FRC07_002961 [Ceratobasidium sp. 392]
MDNKDGIVDAPHEPHDKASAGIRSRITVVCAECKRLKLKCDRRAPCSSCVKRETTVRCVYSAAAAEKIDVQSLHNRVSALEESWRQWTNTQPGQTPAIPPPTHNQTQPPPPPPPPPPAIVASGPDDLVSALVGLDDVSALWAAHLGLHLPHIPLRPSTPDESDDDDLDEDIPPSLTLARQVPISSRTGVTRAHIQLLPSRSVRAALWTAAERAIGPHTGLALRVRVRFEHMCLALESEQQLGPARTKWPLSLLAVGTAGLAIGAQVVSESDGAIPLPPSSPGSSSSSSHSHSQHPSPISPPLAPLPCTRTLTALSLRALSPNGQDADAVLAALLHAARGTLDGRARIAPRVWPDVCRAVGVARGMGLGVDREHAGKEENGEWRRRVWWEVYCADLFTSDYIGLPPSIDDTTFSAALPKEEDEKDSEEDGEKEKEDGMAYFVLKCRLAQLIKTLKRRLLDERPLPLEGAASMERAIGEFTRDLPPAWKLDMSAPTVAMGLGDEEAAIMVQRCELATAANSLILKAYYPFLKQSVVTSSTSEVFASPHQAALACSSAAHTLIHASLAAHKLLPRTRPYAFAKQLFGGAVVAASIAIGTPTGMLARVALEDVRGALGVLRELDMACGAGRRIEGVPGEAVRVVEVLVSKAEAAMGVGSSGVGMKRKRGQDAGAGGDESLGLGFEMPYMGPGVVTCGLEGEGIGGVGVGEGEKEREGTAAPMPVQQPPPPSGLPPTMPPAEPRREKRDSKPAKVSPYPRIGVRVRTNKPPAGAKMARSRAGSSVNGERSPSGGVPSQQQQVTQQQQQPSGLQQQQVNGLQQQSAALQQQQSSGMAQQQQPTMPQQQSVQSQQPQPTSTPSLAPQMTVPHQPSLQVITEQATRYLNGSTGGEYASYAEPSYTMPYLMNAPATPVVRSDYSREFYGGYEYAAQVGMMSEYGKDAGMMPDALGTAAAGLMENGESGQQGGGGWYRTSAGPAPGQTQTQGSWNGGFDAPGWDTRR